jgi:hypothetical protein|tara:strand:+ start:1746 stop:1994 length:249 start_codon:yes stop_codon:yes gene_type:complete
MLVFTHKNARELGEALIEACDIIEGDSALELVTVEKFGPKFVVVENDECVDDTVVAITREKDKTSLQSNNITRVRKFGNARG